MALLWFSLGILAGLFLPGLVAHLLDRADRGAFTTRRLRVDDLLDDALGTRTPGTGRHTAES